MKHLKSYKLFENLNIKKLTEEEVTKILQENCKKFLENAWDYEESWIFRVDANKGDAMLINPKMSDSPRISSNSPTNFHNILISNLDSWRGWPRRNKSLSCASGTRGHASSWTRDTKTYVLVPFDTSKVATCDRSDFWESFGKIPQKRRWMSGSSRPSIANYISELIRDLGHTKWGKTRERNLETGIWYDKIDYDAMDYNWDKLKSFLEGAQMTDALIDKYFKVGRVLVWDSNKNLLENLNFILDPVRNKFKIGDVLDTMKIYSEIDGDDENPSRASLESWIEDECILITPELLVSILMKIKS